MNELYLAHPDMLPVPKNPGRGLSWIDRFDMWPDSEYDRFENYERFGLDNAYWALYHDTARWERPENVIKMIGASESIKR